MENIIWTKKTRQEKILEDDILESHLISFDVLKDIEATYLDNPYHNYLHALKVASYVLRLNPAYFNLGEIKSLLIAALFHDSGHWFESQVDDEQKSIDIAMWNLINFLDKEKLTLISPNIVKDAIAWTIFSERWHQDNRYSKIMWDLDVWVIGEDIVNFLYYSIPLSLEFNQDIETFLTKWQKYYFKSLLDINREIMISPEVKEILPNSYNVIADVCRLNTEKNIEMFNVLKNEDITLEEFREKFFSNL